MTIEVRQMLVKSTVLQERSANANGSSPEPCQDLEEIKDDILAACRRLIIEVLDQKQER